MPDLYQQILKSYEDDPKVQILRKIRGKKALQGVAAVEGVGADWLRGWTPTETRKAKGFLFRRKRGKTSRLGYKVVSRRGGKDSVIGAQFPLSKGAELERAFK